MLAGGAAAGGRDAPARGAQAQVRVVLLDSGLRVSRSSVPAGAVRFVVVNRTAEPRTFAVGRLRAREVEPGGRVEVVVRLTATGTLELRAAAAEGGERRAELTVLERGVKLTRVGSRFSLPVHVTAPPGDDRLFVVEKGGTIRVVAGGRALPEPFLDLTGEVRSEGNEQGLLSMAFAPDYAESGLLYVYYTDLDENVRLVELRRSAGDGNRADRRSARLVLRIVQPSGEHYGGQLFFDEEGYLMFGLGDGGLHRNREPMRAQWGTELHGKILRIDPRARDAGAYGIPPSNPAIGDGWRPEIWAYGLRNPWRFWVDPVTRDFFVADVGEYVRESIDFAPGGRAAGANFGWPCYEGGLPSAAYAPSSCPGALPPLLEYAREGVNCAVVGGLVVRDPRLPGLAGAYLYSDFCGGEVESLRVRRGRAVVRHLGLARLPGVTSFGQDARGRVYVATFAGGVYRLDPRLAPPPAEKPLVDGRRIFLSAGCSGCHILAAAGATGTIGPNLDEARPSRDLVVRRVTEGTALMPSFKDVLSARQIEAVADFVAGSAAG